MDENAASTEGRETEEAGSPRDTPYRTPPFRFGLLAAAVSGLLLCLAHPSAGLWPLAWIGLAPLIVSIHECSNKRQAFRRGYLFGWAYLAPTWYWTGLTIVGWTGSPIGWAALLLLTLLAALFYGFCAVAIWWLSKSARGAWRIVGIASAWTVMEWLRSVGTMSVPWAQISYTQYRFLPIIQLSELTGALGVSFTLVLANAAIAEWWRHRRLAGSSRFVLSVAAVVAAICVAGLIRMSTLRDARPITVAVMQGNFDYKNGITPGRKLRTYVTLTAAAARARGVRPDLYVWAETAAPGDAFNDPIARGALQDLSDRYDGAILTGSRVVDGSRETNSALLFAPNTRLPQRFDKVGLVPFGEYIPFRPQIPTAVQKQFQFFDTDYSPGRSLDPMVFNSPTAGRVAVGPFICYESVYPHYTRTMTSRGANLLVTPSHDQWFMSEAAMEQHLAIVVLRAVENRRDVARSTTDGVSAVIDARGRILERVPEHEAAFLVQTLHLRSVITLYTRFGDWFIAVCTVLFTIAYFSRAIGDRLTVAADE